MNAKTTTRSFLAAAMLSAILAACGGGGGGGGGGISAAPSSGSQQTPRPAPPPPAREESAVESIVVSGDRRDAPLFSLRGVRDDRRPHVKMQINERNVIAVADTGLRGYVVMDDDMARELGLQDRGANQHYRHSRTAPPPDGWCAGAYGNREIEALLYQADVEIGGLRVANANIWVNEDDDNAPATPLIGNSILARFAMQWPYPPSSLSGGEIDSEGAEEAVFYPNSFDSVPFAAPGAILVNGVAAQNGEGKDAAFLLQTGFGDYHAALSKPVYRAAGIGEGESADDRNCFHFADGAVRFALISAPRKEIAAARSNEDNDEKGVVLIAEGGENELVNVLGADFFRGGVQLLARPGPEAHRGGIAGWRVFYKAEDEPVLDGRFRCQTRGGPGSDNVANGFHTGDCGGDF